MKLRLARNLSQVDLAKALGVTKQSISNWENNNIQPSIDMLIRLAQFFINKSAELWSSTVLHLFDNCKC